MRLYQRRVGGMILEKRVVAANLGDRGYKKMKGGITSKSIHSLTRQCVEVTSDVRDRSIPLVARVGGEVREPKKKSRRVHEKICGVF